MSSKKFIALLIGAPGSGKGTVAGRIMNNFKVKHMATGDILRSQVRAKTPIGKEIGKMMLTGGLVSDHMLNKLVIDELSKTKEAVFLDGYPRTTDQADALDNFTHLQTVVFLNIPYPIIMDRLQSRWTHLPSGRVYNVGFNPPKVQGKDDVTGEDLVQREDDKPETVRRRLNVFKNETAPLLDFYRRQGVLAEFAGKTTNEIWPHILKHLKKVFPKEYHLKDPHTY